MDVFGCSPPQRLSDRSVRIAFVLLFVAGAAVRGCACAATVGLSHPDEHQQFLEQAFRMVHGYGQTFWEQDRGMRHPLYPGLLAVGLASLEAAGIDDPHQLAGLLRWAVSALALGACARFAWEFWRRGDAATSLLLMAVLCLSPDIVYSHVHPLSETASIVPILLALAWLGQRPFVAGLLLGVAFGIRFQSGFLITGVVLAGWVDDRFRLTRPMARLLAGICLALLAVGLTDRLVYGAWFHSPFEYVKANLIEGVANNWGVEPWYQYFVWVGSVCWPGFVLMVFLFGLGARREWRLVIPVVAFAAVHMAVKHKEARFLLPVVPLVLAVMAVGVARLCAAIPPTYRASVWSAVAVCLALVCVARLPELPWNTEPFRSTTVLFEMAGRQSDLTGLAVYGEGYWGCGNYFYLRRKLPLRCYLDGDVEQIVSGPEWERGRLNYLICRPERVSAFASREPRLVARSGDFGLYRFGRPWPGQ